MAKSAGSHNIQNSGQSDNDVIMKIHTGKGTAEINLNVCLIIEDLGVDVLIGQPAKIDHEILTMPHLQKVSFRDLNGEIHTCKTTSRSSMAPAEVVRNSKHVTLYPGHSFRYMVPVKFLQKKRIVFSPRKILQQSGFKP